MDSSSIMIMGLSSLLVLCAFTLGVFFFLVGLKQIMSGIKIGGIVFSITAVLLMVGAIYFSDSIGKEKQETLLQEVALMLETTPEQIIMEDISEATTFFRAGKNENLRKVHHDGKSYIVELNGYKLVKLVQEQDISNSK